jgi:hypothetical protein
MNSITSQRELLGTPILTICICVQELLPHIDAGYDSCWSMIPLASFLVLKLLRSPASRRSVERALARPDFALRLVVENMRAGEVRRRRRRVWRLR